MKKLILVLLTALFLAGCGTAAKESEFWEHGTMYRNWNHLRFSWYEYKTAAPQHGGYQHEAAMVGKKPWSTSKNHGCLFARPCVRGHTTEKARRPVLTDPGPFVPGRHGIIPGLHGKTRAMPRDQFLSRRSALHRPHPQQVQHPGLSRPPPAARPPRRHNRPPMPQHPMFKRLGPQIHKLPQASGPHHGVAKTPLGPYALSSSFKSAKKTNWTAESPSHR